MALPTRPKRGVPLYKVYEIQRRFSEITNVEISYALKCLVLGPVLSRFKVRAGWRLVRISSRSARNFEASIRFEIWSTP